MYDQLDQDEKEKSIDVISRGKYLNLKTINDYFNGQLLDLLCPKMAKNDSQINDMPHGNYIWITINWKPGTPIEMVRSKMAECSSHSMIKYYWYNFEQRGRKKSERGRGLHNHLLIMLDEKVPLCRVKRMISRKIKGLIGNSRHLDVRKSNFPSDKLEYLRGNKNDECKDPMVLQDIEFRKESLIEDIYTNYNLT